MEAGVEAPVTKVRGLGQGFPTWFKYAMIKNVMFLDLVYSKGDATFIFFDVEGQ